MERASGGGRREGSARTVPGDPSGLSAAFDSMSAGVYVVDLAGTVTLANPAAGRLLGYDDLVGLPSHTRFHHSRRDGTPFPVEGCPILGVARTRTPASAELDTFFRADGSSLAVVWLASPLLRDGAPAGAVVVFTDATERVAAAERMQVRLANQERAQDELSEAYTRLLMLARLGDAVSTLDGDEGLRRLTRFAVGTVTDCCVVDALDGTAVRRVGLAHADTGAHPEQDVARSLPPLTDASVGSLGMALRTGQPQTVETGTAPRSPDPLDAEQRALFDELGAAYALVVPLVSRNQVLGAMTWMRAEPFDETDQLLGQEAGRRAALGLDNARLHERSRRTAAVLARSMLSVLPSLPGLEVAARYLPAAVGAEVGGDWYDLFAVRDGAAYLVIGDIAGHDLRASAQMGQVRGLLRAVAYDRSEAPSAVLRRTDESIGGLAVGALASAIVARLDGPTLTWSSAGHPPPAVVDADGGVRLLDDDPDLLLGVAAELPRTDHTGTLATGETLWLYTDGLIERPGEPLSAGLARLRQALAGVAGMPLEAACDALLERMLPAAHPDDVAVLGVRVSD